MKFKLKDTEAMKGRKLRRQVCNTYLSLKTLFNHNMK